MHLNNDEMLLAQEVADAGVPAEEAVRWVKDIVIAAEKRGRPLDIKVGDWVEIHGTPFRLDSFNLYHDMLPSVDFTSAEALTEIHHEEENEGA